MSPFTEARVHLGVEIGGAGRHPGAARRAGLAPAALLDPSWSVGLVRDAAARGLDLAILTDTFLPGGPQLDAVALAARIAPVVSGIGLVPQTTVTHTEPFHLSKAVATLDIVSGGRAGWEPVVSRTAAEADLFGRKPAAPADVLWREAGEVVDVVARLWDSWEDDAVIRDVPTGRYVDRDRLHPVAFTGEFFSVAGASITPRPPQGHPLTVVRADEPESLDVAARSADVVRISAASLADARAARDRVRDAVTAAGRRADDVTVLLDVEVHLAASRAAAETTLRDLDAAGGRLDPSSLRVVGTAVAVADLVERIVQVRAADGVTFVPLALPGDLRAITAELVPLLAGRGLFRTGRPGTGLRARFGLTRPANQYEGAKA